jgi:hypothetical protein
MRYMLIFSNISPDNIVIYRSRSKRWNVQAIMAAHGNYDSAWLYERDPKRSHRWLVRTRWGHMLADGKWDVMYAVGKEDV